MSATASGNLHIIDGIMDQYQYLHILKRKVKDSAHKLDIDDRFHFYQVNDLKHKALNVRLRLCYKLPPCYRYKLNYQTEM